MTEVGSQRDATPGQPNVATRRAYGYLSPYEFQDLVGDLLGTLDGARYSRHAASPDQGVDLRRAEGPSIHVVQAKRYVRSTFPQLLADLKKEVPKVEALAPASYTVATAASLTHAQKVAIAALFRPYLSGPERVFGLEDLDQLLDEHDDIERRHVKLWLSSSAVLDATLHQGLYGRAAALREDIARSLPVYVQSAIFDSASTLLQEHGVCIIAGPPGVGKTMLAKVLVAGAIARGYEALQISEDIEEAEQLFRPEHRQVFYYDDFLGQTNIAERGLRKNEDARLWSFMERVANSKSKLLVLTTREYILEQAKQMYERLTNIEHGRTKFLLRMEDYSRIDRAKILFNHLHQSDLGASFKRSFATPSAYLRVVDHLNYNPRLIEQFVAAADLRSEPTHFVDLAVDLLDHPHRLWRAAFGQLGSDQRDLLRVLAMMPRECTADDLYMAFAAYRAEGPGRRSDEFRAALRVLEPTFLMTGAVGQSRTVTLHKPAVRDFLLADLNEAPEQVVAIIRTAPFFEQLERLAEYARSGDTSAPARATPRAFAGIKGAVDRSVPLMSGRLIELMDGPTATRRRVQRYPDSVELELSWELAEERLGSLSRIARNPRFAALRAVVVQRIDQMLARWESGKGYPSQGPRIFTAASTYLGESAIATQLRRLARCLLAHAETYDDFDALTTLQEEWRDAMGPGFFDEARVRFAEWATETLGDREASGLIDEVESLSAIFGVDLSREVEEARRNAPEPDDSYRAEARQVPVSPVLSRHEEDALMEVLFAALN